MNALIAVSDALHQIEAALGKGSVVSLTINGYGMHRLLHDAGRLMKRPADVPPDDNGDCRVNDIPIINSGARK